MRMSWLLHSNHRKSNHQRRKQSDFQKKWEWQDSATQPAWSRITGSNPTPNMRMVWPPHSNHRKSNHWKQPNSQKWGWHDGATQTVGSQGTGIKIQPMRLAWWHHSIGRKSKAPEAIWLQKMSPAWRHYSNRKRLHHRKQSNSKWGWHVETIGSQKHQM